MENLFALLLAGIGLVLVQALLALPWLAALFVNRAHARRLLPAPGKALPYVGAVAGVLVAAGLLPALLLGVIQERSSLETYGRAYGALVHISLTLDFFVLTFFVLLKVWPKGGAVALAAFREGVRQPMFWLLVLFALFAMTLAPIIPYFTFGEDYVMTKELGFDIIMLAAALFAVLLASMSLAEEIEGRTAITLMSKPVSRRQFLLGKFVGVLLAAALMTGALSWYFNGVLAFKRRTEGLTPLALPASWSGGIAALPLPDEAAHFVTGAALWLLDAAEILPGLALGFCQVMVLLAFAIALATRLPMVVTMPVCVVVYFLGHLTPVLVQIAQRGGQGSAGAQMLYFMGNVFDALLPGLELFNAEQALVTDTQMLDSQFLAHVGSVSLYALMYTGIVLLFGLILFEDRDLA